MMHILYLWRGEISTIVTFIFSAYVLLRILKQPFWRMWIHGAILGLAVEVMTEPEWTYSLQVYIWRDVSPFVIAGWGIMFTWLIYFSDKLYYKIYGKPVDPKETKSNMIILFDLLLGVPLFLSNELVGLYGLKIWKYNDILQWHVMIPIINYPLEGLISLILFVAGVSSVVRYWKGR